MSTYRGHEIRQRQERWYYADTGQLVALNVERACGHCGEANTPAGHDACLGTIDGAINACCGHGIDSAAYVQFADGTVIRGAAARQIQP